MFSHTCLTLGSAYIYLSSLSPSLCNPSYLALVHHILNHSQFYGTNWIPMWLTVVTQTCCYVTSSAPKLNQAHIFTGLTDLFKIPALPIPPPSSLLLIATNPRISCKKKKIYATPKNVEFYIAGKSVRMLEHTYWVASTSSDSRHCRTVEKENPYKIQARTQELLYYLISWYMEKPHHSIIPSGSTRVSIFIFLVSLSIYLYFSISCMCVSGTKQSLIMNTRYIRDCIVRYEYHSNEE